MEESEIVLSLLLPTDKNTAKAVHPAMGAFDDPAACPLVGIACQVARFFITGANMSGKSEFGQDRPYLIVIVTPIQTQTLWLVRGGFRSGDNNTVQRSLHQFHIMAVGSFNHQAQRYALTVGQQ